MTLLKFGGSSLATPAHLRAVGDIVIAAARREPAIVVVSAFQGVTNGLLAAARLAERGDPAFERTFLDLAVRHREAVTALLAG